MQVRILPTAYLKKSFKKMKKITLILPRLKYPSGDFSLGLAYIGSYLKENIKNLEINLIDTTYHPNFKYLKDKLKKFKPDIVGIYVDTLMFEDAIKVAKICKECWHRRFNQSHRLNMVHRFW